MNNDLPSQCSPRVESQCRRFMIEGHPMIDPVFRIISSHAPRQHTSISHIFPRIFQVHFPASLPIVGRSSRAVSHQMCTARSLSMDRRSRGALSPPKHDSARLRGPVTSLSGRRSVAAVAQLVTRACVWTRCRGMAHHTGIIAYFPLKSCFKLFWSPATRAF